MTRKSQTRTVRKCDELFNQPTRAANGLSLCFIPQAQISRFGALRRNVVWRLDVGPKFILDGQNYVDYAVLGL